LSPRTRSTATSGTRSPSWASIPASSSPAWSPRMPGSLWGSRTQAELLTCGDRQLTAAGHDHGRVATPALPDLQSASRLSDTARASIGIQGLRAARPTPRGRRTPQNQPEPSPGLGRPSRARRADPTPPREAARASPGHPSHRPAVAPPAGDQEGDLPEPLRPPTSRPHDRRADRADGPREPDLGLPAHPRRASQARLPRRSIHHPAADTSGTPPVHRYVMATVPSHAGLDPAGRGLLPHRLRCDAEADLRVRRPRGCLWGSRSRHRACELRRSDSQARSQVCRYACST
jgi:hypothetical protein